MTESKIIDSITLYSQKGGSDKVYMLQINEVENGMHMVYYANAARGQALKLKDKTSVPVTPEEARKEFDKAVKSKKKGSSKYQESLDSGDTLVATEKSGESSGIDVQLLNEITEAEAIKLCHDDDWVAQQKDDGERRPLIIENNKAAGTNRYGEYTGGLKSSVIKGLDLKTSMILDTEDMGTKLRAFDILDHKGIDLRPLGFLERFNFLAMSIQNHTTVELSPLAVGTKAKLALLQQMIDEKREGLVFKHKYAPYVGGRPSTGGDQLKFKLYDEASVIVAKVNTKRSVLMEIIDTNGDRVTIGNVTIPPNKDIPSVGDIIEVKYLYAYKGGSLYQPSLLKPRPDLRVEECVIGQLKYKPENS